MEHNTDNSCDLPSSQNNLANEPVVTQLEYVKLEPEWNENRQELVNEICKTGLKPGSILYHGPIYPYKIHYAVPLQTISEKHESNLNENTNNQAVNLPNVTIGPIIGLVTETSARILIEVDKSCYNVVMILEAHGVENQSCTPPVIHAVKKYIPCVFVFENLTPDTYYKIHLNLNIPNLVNSGFRTMRRKWSLKRNNASIGIVSQNDIQLLNSYQNDKTTSKPVPWKTLYQLANRGGLDMVIHIGGSVVLNSKFNESETSYFDQALKMAETLDRSDPEYHEKIKRVIREAYRRTWNATFVRYTMANVPNFIVTSEQDVGLDVYLSGVNKNHPKLRDVLICAIQVAEEYQKQLHSDIDALHNIPVAEGTHHNIIHNSPINFLSEHNYTDHHDPYKKFDFQHSIQSSVASSVYGPVCRSTSFQFFHAIGDIGIASIDFFIELFTEIDSDIGIEQIQADIQEAFDPVNGIFRNCRFVIIGVPQMIFDQTSYFNLLKKNEITTVTKQMLQPILNLTTFVLEKLLHWRSEPIRHIREFCVITSNYSSSSLTKIYWNSDSDTPSDPKFDSNCVDILSVLSKGPVIPRERLHKVWINEFLFEYRLRKALQQYEDKKTLKKDNSKGFFVLCIFADNKSERKKKGDHPLSKKPLVPSFKASIVSDKNNKNIKISNMEYRICCK